MCFLWSKFLVFILSKKKPEEKLVLVLSFGNSHPLKDMQSRVRTLERNISPVA
jgi:hypothetical protein